MVQTRNVKGLGTEAERYKVETRLENEAKASLEDLLVTLSQDWKRKEG